MIVLFNDIVPDNVVSADNTNPNYPIGNIKDPFLRKRWQSTETSDTVTIELSTATDINLIAIGYTNAETITLVFYGFDTLGYDSDTIGYDGDSIALNSADAGSPIDIGSCSWVGSSTISKAEITFDAVSSVVYVGKISMGLGTVLPSPESTWEESFDDMSIISVSQSGQVLQERVDPLRRWSFNFPTLNRDRTRSLQEDYIATGAGKPIFVYPGTDDLPLLYCRLEQPITTNKNLRRYNSNLVLVEAR